MVKGREEFNEIPKNEIPDWLNHELFRDCLKLEFPSEDVQVKVISVKPAVAAGENYVAKIYRIRVEVIDGVESVIKGFIIKHVLENSNPDLEAIMKDFGVFNKEAEMYSKILPGFVNEYKKIGENVNFGPKLYKTLRNDANALIFEDLNMRNYFVGERMKGLDLDHCKIFYKKLAKFHAASAVYRVNNGPYDTKLFYSPFNPKLRKFNDDFFATLFPHFLNMLQRNDVLKHLANKIESWFPHQYNELCRISEPSSDPNVFQVLCHGDTWLNNFLFSHDENKNPTDVLFIDYQVCFWISPVYDLIYFFASSTKAELKETSFDYLIHYYHTELVKNLEKLNYSGKIPSLRDLYIEILRKGFIGAVLAPGLMSIVLMEPRDDANLNNMMEGGDDLKKAMFTSPAYVRNVEAWYTFLERKGLLDIE